MALTKASIPSPSGRLAEPLALLEPHRCPLQRERIQDLVRANAKTTHVVPGELAKPVGKAHAREKLRKSRAKRQALKPAAKETLR